jgi:chromosome segregation ATPase
MRERLESFETLSSSNQDLSESIEALQEELRERNRDVSNLKSQLRERSSDVHSGLVRHEQEVSRAKRVIHRVSRDSDDSDAPVHSQAKPEVADYDKPADHFEELFVSYRDENAALRVELEFVQSKCKELTGMLRTERQKNVAVTQQQEELEKLRREIGRWRAMANGPHSKSSQFAFIGEITNDLHNRMFRWSSALMLKMDIAESKFETELDNLSIKLGKLRTAYLQVRVLQNRRFPRSGPIPDTKDFVAHVDRGIRSIDVFSHAYARAHNYPEEKVPRASRLAGNSSTVRRFCRRVEGRPC